MSKEAEALRILFPDGIRPEQYDSVTLLVKLITVLDSKLTMKFDPPAPPRRFKQAEALKRWRAGVKAPEGFARPAELSREYGVNHSSLLSAARRGAVHAKKIEGMWFVDVAAFEKWHAPR